MQIRTMAVQINEKTWPVAVACLGARFASVPFPDVEGSFLVINTPLGGRRGRVLYGSGRFELGISLENIWYSEEDFRVMYKFDGRKNTEAFFDVMKVAEQPLPKNEDEVGPLIQQLARAHFGEEPDQD